MLTYCQGLRTIHLPRALPSLSLRVNQIAIFIEDRYCIVSQPV